MKNALKMFMETRMNDVLIEVGSKPEIKKLDREIEGFGISEEVQGVIDYQASLLTEEAYKVGFKDGLRLPDELSD